MNIVIYEDNYTHRMFLLNVVREFIQKRHYNISLELYTDDTAEVERYVEKNQIATLYLIDIVDNQGKATGLRLSEHIRQMNSADNVVFVTQYLDKVINSTQHKMIALNIISKSKNTKNEICDTIDFVYNEMPNKDYLIINSRYNDIFKVAFRDIYMIESIKGRSRIKIHYHNGIYECAGLLKDVFSKLDKRFNRIHKSYIVNLDSIEKIDKSREITLKNGLKVYFSKRYKIDKEFLNGHMDFHI